MKEIKIPKSIQMGGFDYTIETGKKVSSELNSRGAWGVTAQDLLTIRLDYNASPQQLSNTFLHESIHAIDHIYLQDVLKDDQVAVIANGLHQLLEQLGIRFVR